MFWKLRPQGVSSSFTQQTCQNRVCRTSASHWGWPCFWSTYLTSWSNGVPMRFDTILLNWSTLTVRSTILFFIILLYFFKRNFERTTEGQKQENRQRHKLIIATWRSLHYWFASSELQAVYMIIYVLTCPYRNGRIMTKSSFSSANRTFYCRLQRECATLCLKNGKARIHSVNMLRALCAASPDPGKQCGRGLWSMRHVAVKAPVAPIAAAHCIFLVDVTII